MSTLVDRTPFSTSVLTRGPGPDTGEVRGFGGRGQQSGSESPSGPVTPRCGRSVLFIGKRPKSQLSVNGPGRRVDYRRRIKKGSWTSVDRERLSKSYGTRCQNKSTRESHDYCRVGVRLSRVYDYLCYSFLVDPPSLLPSRSSSDPVAHPDRRSQRDIPLPCEFPDRRNICHTSVEIFMGTGSVPCNSRRPEGVSEGSPEWKKDFPVPLPFFRRNTSQPKGIVPFILV